jgi:hypothetical protein
MARTSSSRNVAAALSVLIAEAQGPDYSSSVVLFKIVQLVGASTGWSHLNVCASGTGAWIYLVRRDSMPSFSSGPSYGGTTEFTSLVHAVRFLCLHQAAAARDAVQHLMISDPQLMRQLMEAATSAAAAAEPNDVTISGAGAIGGGGSSTHPDVALRDIGLFLRGVVDGNDKVDDTEVNAEAAVAAEAAATAAAAEAAAAAQPSAAAAQPSAHREGADGPPTSHASTCQNIQKDLKAMRYLLTNFAVADQEGTVRLFAQGGKPWHEKKCSAIDLREMIAKDSISDHFTYDASCNYVPTLKPGSSSRVVQLKHLIEARKEELTKVHADVMTKRAAVKAALKEIEKKKKKTAMEGRTMQTRKRKRKPHAHDSTLILSRKLRSGSRVMSP